MIHNHDKSICKWSVQKEGFCPYEEMLSKLVNLHVENKVRCKSKECLFILLDKTGEKNEEALVKKKFPELAKPSGPLEHHELLSNINIDAVLYDFALASVPKKNETVIFVNGPYFHIPFEMRDFEKSLESEFKNLDLNALIKKKFKSFGCVLNTDTWNSSNDEGHWVTVFGLISGDEKKVHIEYFNSSGNGFSEFKEIKEWIEKKKKEFPDLKITYEKVVKAPLQGDTVNCGVWCLLYQKSRLEGKDKNYFYKYNVDDEFVDNARKYLFI